MKDFFISYNSNDRDWAEWIAWQLEENGYTTFLQAWDFSAGTNFVQKMQQAILETKRTIAVLSANYMKAKFTHPEWQAAFAKDPTGEKGLLLPIRVRDGNIEGLLPQIVFIDLVDISENEAKKRLLGGLSQKRGPSQPPPFPGKPRTITEQPTFPSNFFPKEKNIDTPERFAHLMGTTNTVKTEIQNLSSSFSLIMERLDNIERLIFPPYFEIPGVEELKTMSELGDITGKVVLVKSDLDIPILSGTGEIIDHPKFDRVCLTLNELLINGAKVILLITQGLSQTILDKDTHVSIGKHVELIERRINSQIHEFHNEHDLGLLKKNVDQMKPGELLILPNAASFGEEVISFVKGDNMSQRDKQSFKDARIVRWLSVIYDIFILDDFRSTIKALPSNVGFAENKCGVIGKGIESDLRGLCALVEACKATKGPRLCLAGSSRPQDLRIILSLLEAKLFDQILVSGYSAWVLLLAKGYDLGGVQVGAIQALMGLAHGNLENLITECAHEILTRYSDKVIFPVDFAIAEEGKRRDVPIEDLSSQNTKIMDIGEKTIECFKKYIKQSEMLFHFGMMGGSYEPFNKGTIELIRSLANGSCQSFMAGDHISGIARMIDVDEKIDYLITGAETTNYFLTGKSLPGIIPFRKKDHISKEEGA